MKEEDFMDRNYRFILLDADDTLLDFQSAERHALEQVFRLHGHEPTLEWTALYSALNRELWDRLERAEIPREEIFRTRFALLLDRLGWPGNGEEWEREYRDELSQRHDLVRGALEVCRDLSRSCRLYILTNGVARTQRARLEASGLLPYLERVFVSEEAGAQKPSAAFFRYAFERIPDFQREQALMVGDSLVSDMKGGRDAGVDTCWYNPKGLPVPRDGTVTWSIQRLEELMKLV